MFGLPAKDPTILVRYTHAKKPPNQFPFGHAASALVRSTFSRASWKTVFVAFNDSPKPPPDVPVKVTTISPLVPAA